MTTNGEWLEYLANNAPDELAAWFDAERTESPTSETMRHIGQVIENTIKRGVYGDTEPQDADSRDKIEADVRKIAEAYNMDTQRHGTERFEHELYYSIIHLLDRQAALTDAEWDDELEQLHMGYKPLIDGLQAQVDELTAERDKLKGQVFTLKCECDDLENERDKLQEQLRIGWECECRLQAERDNLKDELIDERGELNRQINTMRDVIRDYRNERDRYRSKFGKCLDYADAIHALMDDEGMA